MKQFATVAPLRVETDAERKEMAPYLPNWVQRRVRPDIDIGQARDT